jgi:hypothetical protein
MVAKPDSQAAYVEYDVAISFLVADEKIAAAIKAGLGGLNVFFYPHNQEELIGTNGIESMRVPFLNARVNVILYRPRYAAQTARPMWEGILFHVDSVNLQAPDSPNTGGRDNPVTRLSSVESDRLFNRRGDHGCY